MTTFKEQYPVRPTDKNLWYRYNRGAFRQREPLLRDGLDLNSLVLRRTGKFYNEATHQDYDRYQIAGGEDKNLFYRRPNKRLQPILQKRLFKDLEPGSRDMGSLDLTKKERQATAVIEGIQAINDTVVKFIRTPKLHADGSPVLNPITNQPEFEKRSLQEVLAISHTALMNALEKNNIVANDNIKQISLSFTQINVQNILYKFQAIIENNPGITQVQKKEQFLAAILQERLKDLTPVDEPAVEQAIADEIVDEKEIKVPDSWDEKGQETIFPTRGFKPAQWEGQFRDQMSLNAYILAKQKTANRQLRTVAGAFIPVRMMGLMFSKGHILDLDRIRFRRRADIARYHLNAAHPSLVIIAPPL